MTQSRASTLDCVTCYTYHYNTLTHQIFDSFQKICLLTNIIYINYGIFLSKSRVKGGQHLALPPYAPRPRFALMICRGATHSRLLAHYAGGRAVATAGPLPCHARTPCTGLADAGAGRGGARLPLLRPGLLRCCPSRARLGAEGIAQPAQRRMRRRAAAAGVSLLSPPACAMGRGRGVGGGVCLPLLQHGGARILHALPIAAPPPLLRATMGKRSHNRGKGV